MHRDLYDTVGKISLRVMSEGMELHQYHLYSLSLWTTPSSFFELILNLAFVLRPTPMTRSKELLLGGLPHFLLLVP